MTSLKVLQLDHEADGDQIQESLQQITDQTTVPNIFINGDHIGGNSDLQALHNEGQLDALLAA